MTRASHTPRETLPSSAPSTTGLGLFYHIAKKKIPYWDGDKGQTVVPAAVNGIKLELFVFDVFPAAQRWVVLEVRREDEFAPVKNEPGADSVDSPDTARALMGAQARRWLEAAGAVVIDGEGEGEGEGELGCVEVSPLLSYEGEGLESFAGQTVRAPCYLWAPYGSEEAV